MNAVAYGPLGERMAEPVTDARFDELYRLYSSTVTMYLLRRASYDDALEAAAETFATAWRRLDDLPDEPTGWLLATARRQLANVRRGNIRRASLTRRLMLVRNEPSTAEADGSSTEVLATLAALSEADREVLKLFAWDDLDAEQAAVVLGCSAGAVRVRLHRARRRFEREMQRQTQAERAFQKGTR